MWEMERIHLQSIRIRGLKPATSLRMSADDCYQKTSDRELYMITRLSRSHSRSHIIPRIQRLVVCPSPFNGPMVLAKIETRYAKSTCSGLALPSSEKYLPKVAFTNTKSASQHVQINIYRCAFLTLFVPSFLKHIIFCLISIDRPSVASSARKLRDIAARALPLNFPNQFVLQQWQTPIITPTVS